MVLEYISLWIVIKKVLYVGKAKNLKKEYLAMLMIKVKPIGLSY